MSQTSRIEWTEATWNPTLGCTKISPGCKNCYAESMAKRLKAMGTPGYENGFKLTILPDRLAEPLASVNGCQEALFSGCEGAVPAFGL